MKDIYDLDLNLLRILKAVVKTGNTHAAADILGISQTSVSRGIAKLKESFGEQLFIRKSHGLEPSELAQKLAQVSDEIYTPIVKVVESFHNFNQLEYAGIVTVAMNIYALDIHGEGIFKALQVALPKAKLKLVYWQHDSLTQMLDGEIDYMIHFAAFSLPQDIYQLPLRKTKFGVIARKDHPVLSKSQDWENIHHLPIARVKIDGYNLKLSPIEELYRAKGYKANVELVTQSLNILLNKLKNSDAIHFGSVYLAAVDNELCAYPLPTLPVEFRNAQVNGGYLQSRRGFPLYQVLHQTIKNYFDELV